MEIQSEKISDLTASLAKMQSSLRPAKKTSENPFFKSSYADLVSVWNAIREPLLESDLTISQTMLSEDGRVVIVTTLFHTSGQWLRSFLPITPVKTDPQSLGSAITYGRRYSLAAIVGLVTEEEDDDAEGAMDREKKPAKKPEKEDTKSNKVTDKQVKLIWAKAFAAFDDRETAEQAVRDILKRYGVDSTKDMTQEHLEDYLKFIDGIKQPDGGFPF